MYGSVLRAATTYLSNSPPQLPVVVSDLPTRDNYITLARQIYDRIDYMSMVYLVSGNTSYAYKALRETYSGPLAGMDSMPLA